MADIRPALADGPGARLLDGGWGWHLADEVAAEIIADGGRIVQETVGVELLNTIEAARLLEDVDLEVAVDSQIRERVAGMASLIRPTGR